MQSYNGYNSNDGGSMPPPLSMSGMNMNIGATRMNQPYQGHMRSNNQQIPPSSPGYIQPPTTYNTPTPPGQANQQFYGQPLQSPTKHPTSQPQMAAGSPQIANNPLQQAQKAMGGATGEVSKIDAARIDLLLELNKLLIQEVMQLQMNGRAGSAAKQGQDAQTGQQSPTVSDTKDAIDADGEKKAEETTKKGPPPSREYVECMFRLRGNFAYLTNLASRHSQKPQPQPTVDRPTIMEPLSTNIEGNTISEESMNQIKEMYKRLKELFPPSGQQPTAQGQVQGEAPDRAKSQQYMMQQAQQLQQQQQQQMQQQQGMTAQQQAQNMQQQIMQHQQQMAAQSGNMQGMSAAGMGRGQGMNPQMMQQQQQQQMMARAMAGMQNQQGGMGQGM